MFYKRDQTNASRFCYQPCLYFLSVKQNTFKIILLLHLCSELENTATSSDMNEHIQTHFINHIHIKLFSLL